MPYLTFVCNLSQWVPHISVANNMNRQSGLSPKSRLLSSLRQGMRDKSWMCLLEYVLSHLYKANHKNINAVNESSGLKSSRNNLCAVDFNLISPISSELPSLSINFMHDSIMWNVFARATNKAVHIVSQNKVRKENTFWTASIWLHKTIAYYAKSGSLPNLSLETRDFV